MAKVTPRLVRRGNQGKEVRIIQVEIGTQEKTNLRVKAKNNIFLILSVIILLTSCNRGELYFHYNKIDKEEWHRDSVLAFSIDTLKTEQRGRYNISLELTTSALYQYSNMQLKVDHNLNDTTIISDTINFNLADEYGRWLGMGVGSLRQLSVPYKSSIWLDSTRSYEIHISHVMNPDPLKGVQKVGVRVYRDID